MVNYKNNYSPSSALFFMYSYTETIDFDGCSASSRKKVVSSSAGILSLLVYSQLER